MAETPLDRIIKKAAKAMRWPEEIIIPKKKQRAKAPRENLSEKAFKKKDKRDP